MASLNSILAVVAALVVSARTYPPNIGRGSFSYDPNSIDQNEKILRLFLRLASHTANRLIRLKSDARQQGDEARIRVGANVPELRVETPENVPSERIASGGPYDRSGRPLYNNERDHRTAEHGQTPRDRYAPAGDHSDHRTVGPYDPATEGSLSGGHDYGINRAPRTDERRENPRVLYDPYEPAEIERRMLLILEKNNNVTHYNDHSRSTTSADTRTSNMASPYREETASSVVRSGPAMVNQNVLSSEFHRTTHEIYVDGAKTVLNNVPQNAGSGLSSQNPESGSGSDLKSESGSNLESGSESGSDLKSGSGSGSDLKSESGSDLKSESGWNLESGSESGSDLKSGSESGSDLKSGSESGSDLKSGSESGSDHKSVSKSGSDLKSESESGAQSESEGAAIARQTITGASNLQSGSSEATSAVQNSSGGESSTAGAAIARQTMASASNLQSGLNETTSAVQNSSGDQSSTAEAAISRQTMNTASNLHSASMGLINSVQSVASDGQSAEGGGRGGISGEALTAGPNTKPSPLERLATVQTAGSKMFAEAVAASSGNQASQIVSSLADSREHQSAENSIGISDSSKPEGSLSITNPASIPTNRGSSLADPSEEMSVVTNVGTETSGAVTKVAEKGGSEVVRGMQNSAMSVGRKSTGQGGEMLGGLTGAGSKITGSLASEHGAETGRASSERIYERGDSTSAPTGSDRSGVTQDGTSSIGTVPLFRSFSDHSDQSDGIEYFATDGTEGSDEVPTKIANASSVDYENGINDVTLGDKRARHEGDKEGEVSKVELEEYAHRFADALRPVGTKS